MKISEFLAEKGLDAGLSPVYEKLCALSLEWNEKINITAIKDRDAFMEKNIIDSLALANNPALDNAKRIIDMGTGGGFPGLVLAIAYPDKEFVLCDSVGKKLKVIDDEVIKLNIHNVTTVHARAEDLALDKDMREGFDLAVSRAVAALPSLCEYCLPFVKVGGFFIAYKTEAADAEIKAAERAVKLLGGGAIRTYGAGLEGCGHSFVEIEKKSKTPVKYPRKAGLAVKQPL